MEFKVKRDFLPIFLVNLVLVFIFACSVFFFGNSLGWLLTVIVVDLSLLFLYNSSVIFTYCRIDETTLAFRTGVFYHDIKLNTIKKVSKATNFHCSLAPSIQRIRILTEENGKQKVYYVSVVDREKLMSMLEPNKTQEVKTEETKVESNEVKPATNKNVVANSAKKSSTSTANTNAKKSSTSTKKEVASTTKKTSSTKKETK